MSARVKHGNFRRSCRRCDWSGTYTTAGRGDYAKRKHSCEKNLQLAARHARGDARRVEWSKLDRSPKPCLHKIAEHQHGNYSCYTLDACRCQPCTDAASAYERQRVRNNAYGRGRFVDAEPARQHVLGLMAAGMGMKRMVALGHTSHGQLWKLLYGKKRSDGTQIPSPRITRDVEKRLLAIELDLADAQIVDGTDTARRLQALVANGWSISKLGRRIGMKYPGNLTPIVHGQRPVLKHTALAVYDMYVELLDLAPPEDNHRDRIAASRSRNMAVRNGWKPPLRIHGRPLLGRAIPESAVPHGRMPRSANLRAEIAEPVPWIAHVDHAAIERRLAGDRVRLTAVEAAEVVRRWAASGRSLNECERVTGIKPDRHPRPAEQVAS